MYINGNLVQMAVFTHSVQQGVLFLCSGLDSVRQLEQSLLIVDDVQVVDAGFHLWTAALSALVAYRRGGISQMIQF